MKSELGFGAPKPIRQQRNAYQAGWYLFKPGGKLFVAVGVGVGLFLLGFGSPGNGASLAAKPGVRQVAVSSEAPRAAKEASVVLRQGGSAADAAVVAALVAGVVNSTSSGIGGGGFANYWDASTGTATIVDFRETAPQAIDASAFEARPFPHEQRGRLVGVPGEIAGLYELHRRQGKLKWSYLVERAASVAREGFVVGPHVAKVLAFSEKKLKRDAGLRALWLRGGKLPAVGSRVKNPQLAATLSRIAKEGPKAFYEGSVAAEIIKTVRSAGGVMTLRELAAYRPVIRKPLKSVWNGQTVYTMPAPSAGGYMLAHTLSLYSPAELYALGLNSPAYVHALAESFRAALADRMRFYGDSQFVKVAPHELLNKKRMTARRAQISFKKTKKVVEFTSDEHGTHHLVTADAEGNVVSLTLTVNRPFGAKLMAPASGVVLNDELGDFTKAAWIAPFGMKESPNRPRAGARPVSSMTPTLVVRGGRVTLATGGSGGMTIATNVAQLVVSHLLFGVEAKSLVSLPRFQIPLRSGTIKIPKELGAGFVAELEKRGEEVLPIKRSMSGVQALSWHGNRISGGADARKHGLAIVE